MQEEGWLGIMAGTGKEMARSGGRRTRRHRGGLFGKKSKARKAREDAELIETMYPASGAVAHGHAEPVEGCKACDHRRELEEAAAKYRALPWRTRRRTKNPIKTARKTRRERMKKAAEIAAGDKWARERRGTPYYTMLAREGKYEDGSYKHADPIGIDLEWDDTIGGRKRRRGRKGRKTRRGRKGAKRR